MSTIWDILSGRLTQGHEGTGVGTPRGRLVVTGAWAYSRALRRVLSSIRSMLWSFSRVQEAVRVMVSGGAIIVRVSAPYAGSLLRPHMKGRSITGPGVTAKRRGGEPPRRRGTVPLTVILSLSAAGSVAKSVGTYATAISSALPSSAPFQDVSAGSPPAVEGTGAEPVGSEGWGALTPASPAGKAIREGIAKATARPPPQWGIGRGLNKTPASSGLAFSSSFMATAALLGVQATASLFGAARSAFSGWAPRAPTTPWKGAGAATADSAGPTGGALPSEGVPPPPHAGMELPELQAVRRSKVSTGGVPESAANGRRGFAASAVVEAAKRQISRYPTPHGAVEAASGAEAMPEVGGMTAPRALEGGGEPADGWFERLDHRQEETVKLGAFLPLAAIIERADFRRAAGILKLTFGAVPPALFALTLPTMAFRLPGREIVPPSTNRSMPSRQVSGGQASAPGSPPSSLLLWTGVQGPWREGGALAVPNLVALADEVRTGIITPQPAIPPNMEARSGIGEGHEATAKLPIPMELEEPQVYPMRKEVKVNVAVEGDEDLLELQRKISRIIEDEMRRHYGEG